MKPTGKTLSQLRREFYVTSYCNKAHRMSDGAPIQHECYYLPPNALINERNDCDEASRIIQAAKPLRYSRTGVRS